jgi:hypothetical protein
MAGAEGLGGCRDLKPRAIVLVQLGPAFLFQEGTWAFACELAGEQALPRSHLPDAILWVELRSAYNWWLEILEKGI